MITANAAADCSRTARHALVRRGLSKRRSRSRLNPAELSWPPPDMRLFFGQRYTSRSSFDLTKPATCNRGVRRSVSVSDIQELVRTHYFSRSIHQRNLFHKSPLECDQMEGANSTCGPIGSLRGLAAALGLFKPSAEGDPGTTDARDGLIEQCSVVYAEEELGESDGEVDNNMWAATSGSTMGWQSSWDTPEQPPDLECNGTHAEESAYGGELRASPYASRRSSINSLTSLLDFTWGGNMIEASDSYTNTGNDMSTRTSSIGSLLNECYKLESPFAADRPSSPIFDFEP